MGLPSIRYFPQIWITTWIALRRHFKVIIAFVLMLGTAHLAIPLQSISSCYSATMNSENEDESDETAEKEGRESKDNQNEEDDRELEEFEKDYFGTLHLFDFSPNLSKVSWASADKQHYSVITDIALPPPKI